tara:strand:+ start:62940 stop:63842 length:903 start_codon:yes stop_codon:yes gene_type:complete
MSEPTIDLYPHLGPSAKDYVELGNDIRIGWIRSPRWIGYPKAKDILNKLDDLLIYPKRHRMPNLLIVGDSNSGKTMIADRFSSMHKAYEKDNNEGIVIPVLSIQAPPVPSESRLYSNILDKIFAPYRPSDSAEKKHHQVVHLVRACNVQMLLIDEIHSILAGNLEKQRVFLSVLRNLGNELKIPIVGLGTKDALRALKTDPQLDNRFKPILLAKWEYTTDYRRLIASFESVLPLKKASNLSSKAIAMKLLSMTEGLLGELSELLSEAAIEAIVTGKECIDLELLSRLDWLAPTARRSQRL